MTVRLDTRSDPRHMRRSIQRHRIATSPNENSRARAILGKSMSTGWDRVGAGASLGTERNPGGHEPPRPSAGARRRNPQTGARARAWGRSSWPAPGAAPADAAASATPNARIAVTSSAAGGASIPYASQDPLLASLLEGIDDADAAATPRRGPQIPKRVPTPRLFQRACPSSSPPRATWRASSGRRWPQCSGGSSARTIARPARARPLARYRSGDVLVS